MNTLEDLNADIAMGVQVADRSDDDDKPDNSVEFGNRTREEINDGDEGYTSSDGKDTSIEKENEDEDVDVRGRNYVDDEDEQTYTDEDEEDD
jgi:hypothetical protein